MAGFILLKQNTKKEEIYLLQRIKFALTEIHIKKAYQRNEIDSLVSIWGIFL
ncbi:MAG: hypothetical protein AAGU27_20395 [Dehalobacterium sp.]